MARFDTEGIEDLIQLTSSSNNSKRLAGPACESSAVLAFLQLEREKVITKLRRIEELLGRNRIHGETINIPAEISQPLYTEEGFGMRQIPDFPTLKPRPRPPLKGLVIPSVKKPYFGLKSKWTKQTIHEACKQQLPELKTPPGGHLCQPMCDGCLHSYIVLYLGLENDKQHGDDPNWKPTGYPSVWNDELSHHLRHSLPHRRCSSCKLRMALPIEGQLPKKTSNKLPGKLHSIHEVVVPRKAVRKAPVKASRSQRVKQPLVVDAPDLSILDACMSNVDEEGLRTRTKVDPIEVVGRINDLAATNPQEPGAQQQMNIANCVVKSMSIDSAVFGSAQFRDATLKDMIRGVDGDYLEKANPEHDVASCQGHPSYALKKPEDFANPCRVVDQYPIYKEPPERVQSDDRAKVSELHRQFSTTDVRPPTDIRRQRWSACRRPPFHMGVEEGAETPRDVSNNSLNLRQHECLAKPMIVPRTAAAELAADEESLKGEEDLEIDLRIIIDNEENVSLEVENVRYRSSEGSAPKKKSAQPLLRKTEKQMEPDSSERTSAFDSEE